MGDDQRSVVVSAHEHLAARDLANDVYHVYEVCEVQEMNRRRGSHPIILRMNPNIRRHDDIELHRRLLHQYMTYAHWPLATRPTNHAFGYSRVCAVLYCLKPEYITVPLISAITDGS